MSYGVTQFEISNIHNSPPELDLWWAEVKFGFDELIDETEVTHWVTVKVRVINGELASIADLREALLQKALDVLQKSLDRAAGLTASELLEQEALRVRAERQANSFQS